MYKSNLPVDTREAAATERRKDMEKQRQARIFNARERTMGLDLQLLEHQVQEREIREEQDRERDAAFAVEMNRHDKIAELLQERQEKDARQLKKELTDYWKENQQMQDRREFDLNDPDYKKKGLPTRVTDNDPHLTVSSIQKLDGEDLQYETRKELQQEQTRDWLGQQMQEKERHLMEEKKAESLYNKKLVEMDERAVDLAMADEATRKAINTAIKDYNMALAKEKLAQQQREWAQEQDDNFTEIANHINGDFLTENPAVAQSSFGMQRVIPDRWKGMSPAQVREVLEKQRQQIEEKKIRDSKERELQKEWERRALAEARAGLLMENQEAKQRAMIKKQITEENKELQEEQTARLAVLTSEVYTNKIGDDFFAQFGTSSR